MFLCKDEYKKTIKYYEFPQNLESREKTSAEKELKIANIVQNF